MNKGFLAALKKHIPGVLKQLLCRQSELETFVTPDELQVADIEMVHKGPKSETV
jgi:hypothetical protein